MPAGRWTRHLARKPQPPSVRSLTTLCLFGAAAVVALKYPLVGLGICICCLIGYLRPETHRHGTEA
jgi:hypothetical protein